MHFQCILMHIYSSDASAYAFSDLLSVKFRKNFVCEMLDFYENRC